MIRVWIWDDIEPWAQIYTLCSSIVTSFLFLKLICHKWKRPDQPNVCVYVTCHVSSSTCLWHAKHLYACSICISVTCKGICKFYQACGTTALLFQFVTNPNQPTHIVWGANSSFQNRKCNLGEFSQKASNLGPRVTSERLFCRIWWPPIKSRSTVSLCTVQKCRDQVGIPFHTFFQLNKYLDKAMGWTRVTSI